MQHSQGVVNPNLVSWVDILPTAIDWAGLDPKIRVNPDSPPRLGRSILPILILSDLAVESYVS